MWRRASGRSVDRETVMQGSEPLVDVSPQGRAGGDGKGGGYSGPVNYFSVARQEAVLFGAVRSCVEFIVSDVVQAIVEDMRVVDRKGETVERPDTEALLILFRELSDGVNPTSGILANVLTDFLLSGDGLLGLVRGYRGNVTGLRRIIRSTASITGLTDGSVVYRGRLEGQGNRYFDVLQRDVVRVTWSDLTGNSGYDKWNVSPVGGLAASIGLEANQFVMRWFKANRNMGIHFGFSEILNKNQIVENVDTLASSAASNKPYVTQGNVGASVLDTSRQPRTVSELVELMVRDVCRVYGVPTPFIAIDVQLLGSGIETLRRMWLQRLRSYVNRVLNPLSAQILPRGLRFDVNYRRFIVADYAAAVAIIGATGGAPGVKPSLSTGEHRELLGYSKELPPELAEELRAFRESSKDKEPAAAPAQDEDEDGDDGDDGENEDEEVAIRVR